MANDKLDKSDPEWGKKLGDETIRVALRLKKAIEDAMPKRGNAMPDMKLRFE